MWTRGLAGGAFSIRQQDWLRPVSSTMQAMKNASTMQAMKNASTMQAMKKQGRTSLALTLLCQAL